MVAKNEIRAITIVPVLIHSYYYHEVGRVFLPGFGTGANGDRIVRFCAICVGAISAKSGLGFVYAY